MDKQRRNLLKAGAGLSLVSTLPLQAQGLSNSDNRQLQILLQDGAIDTRGNGAITAGAIVSFTNQTANAIYLSPATKQSCPFTEGWPTCIGPNQTVKRIVLDNISGNFNFSYYPLAFAGDIYTSGADLSLSQKLAKTYYHPQGQFQVMKVNTDKQTYNTQDPASDGEIIVQDH